VQQCRLQPSMYRKNCCPNTVLLMDVSELERKLGELVRASDYETVIAVYMYGSCVRGDARKDSDVDLAFLLDQKAYIEDPLEAATPAYLLAARFGLMVDREIDVMILNSASLEMVYEIVSTGTCVYEVEAERRLEYEIKIRGLYFDFRPFIENLRAKKLEAL
jgi:predicted nucleotidyltransferase